jgi:hypothetical protein
LTDEGEISDKMQFPSPIEKSFDGSISAAELTSRMQKAINNHHQITSNQ